MCLSVVGLVVVPCKWTDFRARIYKEKYMNDTDGRAKQPRDKTRTRTIFGRKKSSAS